MSSSAADSKTFMQKVLDVVERVGNKVPHPAVIFLILIAIVVVLSHVLYVTGTTISYEAIVPKADAVAANQTESTLYDYGMSVDYGAIDAKSYSIEQREVAAKSL